MTPEEMAARMKECETLSMDDPEVAHGYAEDMMVAQLRSLGYGDAMNIFINMKKWYA